jgi:hypothetical protein
MDQETAVNDLAGANRQVFRKSLAELDRVGVFVFKADILPDVEKRVNS